MGSSAGGGEFWSDRCEGFWCRSGRGDQSWGSHGLVCGKREFCVFVKGSENTR